MKFGVRQIANVVFRAKNNMTIGNKTFQKGQPVFYLDTAKTSTVEGGATSVYATGGRGDARLVSWEGEKTLTFTVEDALISPISLSMLSGAGVVKGNSASDLIHFHQCTMASAVVSTSGGYTSTIDLSEALETDEVICPDAPIFVMQVDDGGDLTGKIYEGYEVTNSGTKAGKQIVSQNSAEYARGVAMVDYYVLKKSTTVTEIQIDAEHFGGYFYVEADTLWRSQIDGKDYPTNMTFPNVKIQSNFTFSMSASGDPSTFSFTMDAFPGYTYFDRRKKVLCAIQVVDSVSDKSSTSNTVFPHPAVVPEQKIEEATYDSTGEITTDTHAYYPSNG